MKLNNNPLIWALVVAGLGWWFVNAGRYEEFVVLAFAVVVAKLIEIINLNNKG